MRWVKFTVQMPLRDGSSLHCRGPLCEMYKFTVQRPRLLDGKSYSAKAYAVRWYRFTVQRAPAVRWALSSHSTYHLLGAHLNKL
jgi:hypothetical protein